MPARVFSSPSGEAAVGSNPLRQEREAGNRNPWVAIGAQEENGLWVAVGHWQPETQMSQDPTDRIGVFDRGHDAHLFLTARTDQGVRFVHFSNPIADSNKINWLAIILKPFYYIFLTSV